MALSSATISRAAKPLIEAVLALNPALHGPRKLVREGRVDACNEPLDALQG
jgi:hypothetical protein